MTNPTQPRSLLSRVAFDASLAGALLAALAAVFAVDGLTEKTNEPSQSTAIEVVELPPEVAPAPPRKLRLCVTPEPAVFDDMGRLLDTLGEGYKYVAMPLEHLTDPDKLAEVDILFITCSGVPLSWLDKPIGNSDRGMTSYTPNEVVYNRLRTNLRDFAKRGGIIYASDLQFQQTIESCFEEFIDRAQVAKGVKQKVHAKVVDAGLRELLGEEIELNFDQDGWYPAAFHTEKSTVYLEGEFKTSQGDMRRAPLLLKFPFGDGGVIFTSFHNEAQNSEKETALLRYLVFTAVTAEVEARVNQTLIKGGFSPAKRNLFSASAEEPSNTQIYHCTKPGQLRFVLGFQNQGARLKLTVTSPTGQIVEKEGDSSVTIEVADAAVGDWKYTVTALKLPNANFPFTVTVGQK